VSLLGELSPAADADYVRRRAARAHAQAQSPRSLGFAEPYTADTGAALAGLAPFTLAVQDVRYVDARGGMHPVGLDDVAAAFVDPFAHAGAALLQRLNGDEARSTYAALCLAFFDAPLAQALLAGVDRHGVTVMGREAEDAPWREFRFAFSAEQRGEEDLLATLAEMAAEAKEHLAKQGLATD